MIKNFKQFYEQNLEESGLIKLPIEITKWISENIDKVWDICEKMNTEDNAPSNIVVGKIIFKNPYGIDPYKNEGKPNPYGEGLQGIDVEIFNSFKNVKEIKNKSATAIFSYEHQTVAIDASEMHSKEELTNILYHELTHAVDPKLNKDEALHNKSQKYGNRYSRKSPAEYDAHVQEIIRQIISSNKQKEALEWAKNGGKFPILPEINGSGAFDFSRFIKSFDKDQLFRFRKILVKHLT